MRTSHSLISVRHWWRFALPTLAVALCAAFSGAATARAAGPNDLWPNDTVTYPTWFWGSTQLCAYNYDAAQGSVGVSPIGAAYESFSVNGYSTTCIRRSWWGNYIKVIDTGTTRLRVWTN